jgi:hypothetical protein
MPASAQFKQTNWLSSKAPRLLFDHLVSWQTKLLQMMNSPANILLSCSYLMLMHLQVYSKAHLRFLNPWVKDYTAFLSNRENFSLLLIVRSPTECYTLPIRLRVQVITQGACTVKVCIRAVHNSLTQGGIRLQNITCGSKEVQFGRGVCS